MWLSFVLNYINSYYDKCAIFGGVSLLKSIKSKIIVFAILATFIPSLGLGFLSFHQNKAIISDNVASDLRASASHASRALDLWVNEHVYTARALSTSNIIIDELSQVLQLEEGATEDAQKALMQYLRSVHEMLETMLELTVVDTSGLVIASSVEVPTLVSTPQNWPQNALVQEAVVSPPHWDETYGTAKFSVAVPISSYDGPVLGAVVVTLDLRTMQSALKDKERSPQGGVLLLNENGRVLLASHIAETKRLFLGLEPLRHLQEQLGKVSFFHGVNHREVIGLAYMSKMLPVTVLAERDSEEVYADWVKQRNLFLALASVLILIVAAVAIRMGRSIVVPLQKLVDATKQIVKGDFDVNLIVKQKDELGLLTQTFNQMSEKLRHKEAEILAANQAMQRKNQLLETLSVTDSLTGLYNRNKLNLIISDQLARYERNKRPFAVLMIDVDYFKQLNDSLGHIAGDEILVAVARIFTNSIRNVDFAARYGGDEFIVILVETTVDEAMKTAERIRTQVVDVYCSTIYKNVEVTLSMGVVQSEPCDTTPTLLLSRADEALYEAKRAGRNCAYCAKVND